MEKQIIWQVEVEILGNSVNTSNIKLLTACASTVTLLNMKRALGLLIKESSWQPDMKLPVKAAWSASTAPKNDFADRIYEVASNYIEGCVVVVKMQKVETRISNQKALICQG